MDITITLTSIVVYEREPHLGVDVILFTSGTNITRNLILFTCSIGIVEDLIKK